MQGKHLQQANNDLFHISTHVKMNEGVESREEIHIGGKKEMNMG